MGAFFLYGLVEPVLVNHQKFGIKILRLSNISKKEMLT